MFANYDTCFLGSCDSALAAEPGESIKQRLAALWPQTVGPLMQALEARMKDRTEGLHKLLAERAEKEITDITAILSELAQAIEQELKEPEYLQLELFSTQEREQLQVNTDALRLRLSQIPGEIEKEAEIIRARYADPTPRLFPVTVTFLVPEKLV